MKQYHKLLQTIISEGTYKEPAREGMPGTTSLFGAQSRYDLQEGFPLMTTKKMYWKGVVIELLWFLRGDTNIKFLDEHGVRKMWHEDAYNFYVVNLIKGIPFNERDHKILEEKMTFDQFCEYIKVTPREELYSFDIGGGETYTIGDCGFQYGKVWRKWETGVPSFGIGTTYQIAKVIHGIKANPYGRRHIVTAIDPGHDSDLALYWCHAMFQFNCRRIKHEDRLVMYSAKMSTADYGKDEQTQKDLLAKSNIPEFYLDCQLMQRSGDVLLGVPFNTASYALLTHIIAKIVNMVPGEFIHTYGDVHIYDNHMDAVLEQLKRDSNKYPLPKLELIGDWSVLGDNYDFSSITHENFSLIGYESYPKLESDTTLSTGMVKPNIK